MTIGNPLIHSPGYDQAWSLLFPALPPLLNLTVIHVLKSQTPLPQAVCMPGYCYLVMILNFFLILFLHNCFSSIYIIFVTC